MYPVFASEGLKHFMCINPSEIADHCEIPDQFLYVSYFSSKNV